MTPNRIRALAVKRAFDIAAALAGLAILLPFFAPVAAAVVLDTPGPAFWSQVRIGRNGRPFRILKFRTMRAAVEGAGPNYTLSNDARITRLGALLRASKFDELPQLINVLRGDMSLVGPRPETPDLLAHYTPEQRALMLSVRPGLTDHASILLRDEGELLARAPDPERYYRETLIPLKCEMCRRYLEEIGLRADIGIILNTVAVLVPLRRIFPSRTLGGGAGPTAPVPPSTE
jgi:lipopolysaccharide/colanic/teichoic acid biosynthesis glycosyltransferase